MKIGIDVGKAVGQRDGISRFTLGLLGALARQGADHEYRLYPLFPVADEDSRYRRKSLVLGLEIDGHFKAYPFSELSKSPRRFTDEFQGQAFEVHFDKKNDTASVVGNDGDEFPALITYWFAWFAFHPETAIYTAD